MTAGTGSGLWLNVGEQNIKKIVDRVRQLMEGRSQRCGNCHALFDWRDFDVHYCGQLWSEQSCASYATDGACSGNAVVYSLD